MRAALLLLLFAAACEQEWVREYHGALPGDNRPGPVFLVRDYLTGKPIAGAVVRPHAEWSMGRDGRWAPGGAEKRTDELGLVSFRVPSAAPNFHWAVHAEGYAPTETYGTDLEEEIELRPPLTCSGRVLGIDGRPLVNALVEWKVGCAHSPSLAGARTDSTGLFTLEGIDDIGEFVLEGPPGAEDYVEAAPPPGPVPVCQILPGRTLRGRILRADGTPPAWAVVCGSARAPRAAAARDGAFTLQGFTGGTLWVWWDGGLEEIRGEFAPGMPAALVVGGHATEPRLVHVRVDLRDESGAPPPVALPLHFDNVADGRRIRFEWSPYGTNRGDSIPAGTYRVSAGDSWSAYVSEARTVRVPEEQRIELSVRPQPVLSFDLAGLRDDAPVRCWIVLEEESHRLRPGDDEPTHLPATGRAWLRVCLGCTSYTFPIGPARDDVRRADVRLPGRKFIRIPGLEEGVKAALVGEAAEIADGPDPSEIQIGSAGLATYGVGERLLRIADPERGWAAVKLDLPFEAATLEPDCTLTPWPAPVELRVLLDDGTPLASAHVEVLDQDVEPFGCLAPPDEPSDTDESGILRRRWLRTGTHVCVRVHNDDRLPTWARLEGGPPFEIRVGTAAVEVNLAGLEEPSGVLDGLMWEGDEETIAFRGLAAGAHTLLVGAKGRTAVAYRLMLRRGETRRIKPVLR